MGYGAITGQGYVYPVPIPDGGTGATTAQGARQNLEVGKTVFSDITCYANGWNLTGDVYEYRTSIGFSGNMLRYQPIIYLLPSSDATAAANQKTAFALLADYGEVTNLFEFILRTSGSTKPSVDFTVLIVGEVV